MNIEVPENDHQFVVMYAKALDFKEALHELKVAPPGVHEELLKAQISAITELRKEMIEALNEYVKKNVPRVHV